MKLLITGASSYVGARIIFDLKSSFFVIGTYAHTQLCKHFLHLDLRNTNEVNRVVNQVKPDVIIHVASLANSKQCEADPAAAEDINIYGTKRVVAAANTAGAKVIYVSSMAARDRSKFYGRSKAASDAIVKGSKRGFSIIRPHTIYGFSPNTANDRPFNRLLKNLDSATAAVYEDTWKFQTTYLHHISEVIECVLRRKLWGEDIPVFSQELKSRFEVARDVLSAFKIKVIRADFRDDSPVTVGDSSYLKKNNLPYYTYTQIINNIREEIKNRKKFILE